MADQESALEKAGVSLEAPGPALPLTEAAFIEELLALFKRGEAAGLSPVTIAARVCFRRGVSIFDGWMATVESGIGSGKKG